MHRTRSDLDIVRPADIEPQPWANGIGATRVLAARPAWRISLAEIEGRMPFSPFLGADRVLIPLGLVGVTLEIDDTVRRVRPFTGAAFRGEDHVVADTVGERAAVVNLMSRRSSGRMHWEIRRVSGRIDADADAGVVLGGEVRAGSEVLPVGTVFGLDASRTVTGAEGVVAFLGLRPH